ncbi:MAG: serine/threonine-protein kinase [Gemmataceae bacterium]
MMSTDMQRLQSLFGDAAEITDPANRAAYLERECGGDEELRQRVEKLLAAHEDSQDLPPADKTGVYSPTTSLVGTVIAGRYKLLEEIGEGGMGTVWMAEQREPVKRHVGLKLIKPGMDSRAVLARFEAERQALAMMDHPHIAKVLDGGVHEGRPYFVMELVKGVTITQYCDARRLTPHQRLELFVPVCQAIQHAHQKGVIHRDIKPANVLVALYDDKPVPKVIDFGVAKATGHSLTEHTLNTGFGGIIGTPQYMSPEQATFNNLDIDTRSDVYSLGVLLYELLTGSPPFRPEELEKRGLLEILRVVREEEPPKPSTKLSTADALPSLSAERGTEPKKLTGLLRNELDWVVMKALEKDRSRRYETANAFAADVQRYLYGEAVLAHPPTTAYRLKKWAKKNRVAVLFASIVWLITLTQVGFSTLQWLNAERARAAEAEERRKAELASKEASERRQEAEEQRRLTEYRAATLSVDLALQTGGHTAEGLVRLAGTLKSIPSDAVALRQGIITNLLVWGQDFAPAYRRPIGTIHAISPDGRVGLIDMRDPINSWEARNLITGKRLALLGEEGTSKTGPYYEDRAGWAAFSNDGKLAVTIYEPKGNSPTIRVWDSATWREQTHICTQGGPFEVRFSSDGSRIATRSAVQKSMKTNESDQWQYFVQIWDSRTGQEIATLDHGGKPVDHIRFSPKDHVLMTASGNNVRLWSATDGKLLQTFGPHADPVTLTAFNPSGRILAVTAGSRVYWWNAIDGTSAGRSMALGYSPMPDDPDEINRFMFETEDVLIARAWNVHGVSFGRRVGGAVCIRGEAKAHALDVVCSDGHFALTDDRLVYSLSPFRRLETPPGRKFPTEVLEAANGRRYVQVSNELIDLFAELPIGPQLTEANTDVREVRAPGFGFVVKQTGHNYWKGYQMLIPAPTVLPPDDVMVLWTKVLARGHIDPNSGLFKKDDEDTWERNRRELTRYVEPTGEFPFPGPVASDPTFWLRQAYREANEPSVRLAIAERLVDAQPTWQNHLHRANTYATLKRYAEAIREDLKVREWAKSDYKIDPEEVGSAWSAVTSILSKDDCPKEEYELALKWLRVENNDATRIAIALYRLNKPGDAIRELSTLDIPQLTDVITGFASPWAALTTIDAQIRSLNRQATVESTLPYIIEALCHEKLGNNVAANRCLTLARELIRWRDESKDPLFKTNSSDWYGSLVGEALKIEQRKKK